jgi:multisubunit Na+/H+ antiporter MnhB subunit
MAITEVLMEIVNEQEIDMSYEPDKDPNYLEWKDSREATARFDSVLIDLRKYGFTLITGLITAGSFLGFSSPDFTLLQGVIMVTMGLIVILYWLDMYY